MAGASIVGAGLAGLCAAYELDQRGHTCVLSIHSSRRRVSAPHGELELGSRSLERGRLRMVDARAAYGPT
jgi:glycine/D-amino acid oxidase-like deaminating enzyme